MVAKASGGKRSEGKEKVYEPADRARDAFGDLLDRAGFRGERIRITRNGKEIAALISIEDLNKLEQVA